ncbi:MAG TPA: hypothetical protein VGK22_05295 [Candidatus Angelobacter sp.]|jgi:hypothetical protein
MQTDAQFIAALTAYLFQSNEASAVPLFYQPDGSINRTKTLTLPCYANFTSEQ